MKISVNGENKEVQNDALSAVLQELGYGEARVATAVNEVFVPMSQRDQYRLSPGDRLEVVAPQQGG